MNPFQLADANDSPLSQWGEGRLIAAIQGWLGASAPAYPEGPGDDCAVLPACADRQLITTDSVIYGRHFDDAVTAFQAGEKLLKRNASDIAAMAGVPDSAVIAVVCGKNLSVRWLENFCKGMAHGALACNIRLVGGDLAQGPDGTFSASMALLGHAAFPMLRKGAGAGDLIFVTGELGGSRACWHHAFVPRIKEAQWLAAHAQPKSMIDITDGLAKDLRELLPDGCDALLDIEALPLRAEARLSQDEDDPLTHALCDGEDYELLFTLPENTDLSALRADWQKSFSTRLSCIGRIEPSENPAISKRLRNARTHALLSGEGYAHF